MKPGDQAAAVVPGGRLPIIFGFVESLGYRNGATPDSFDRLPREVTWTFNRQNFDDVITGRIRRVSVRALRGAHVAQGRRRARRRFFPRRHRGVRDRSRRFPAYWSRRARPGSVTKFFRGMFGSKLEELECGVPALDQAMSSAPTMPAWRVRWSPAGWRRRCNAAPKPGRNSRRGWRSPGSDGFLVIPLTQEFLRTAGDFGAAGLQDACRADGRRHGRACSPPPALVRKVGAADDNPAGARRQP